MNRTTKRIAPLCLMLGFTTWCCWQSLEAEAPFFLLAEDSLPPSIRPVQLEPSIPEHHAHDPFAIVTATEKSERTKEDATILTSIAADPIVDLTDVLSSLELNATYLYGDRRLAMINGQTFTEGQSSEELVPLVESGTIAQISHDAVLVDVQGQTYRLSYSGLSLVSAAETNNKPVPATGPFFLRPFLRILPALAKPSPDATE